MANKTLICDQHISGNTLSAWRDDLLPPAEMARIRIHAAQCAACQARLAAFESVASALRRQRDIEPDGRLLAALRARAAHPSHRAIFHLPNRRVWQGLGALGSVAAILLLFVYFLGAGPGRTTGPLTSKTPTAHATANATATLPVAPLSWKPLSMPPNDAGGMPLDISPADGDIFYACDLTSAIQGGSVTVWVSRDRTAHWQRTTPIPVRAAVNICLLHADMLNPSTAVIEVSSAKMGASPQLSTFTSYVTTDYGQHWRTLTFPQPAIIYQIATRGTSAYAILRGDRADELAVSTDDMRTWQRVDSGITEASQATAFWLNPASGSLLVWWTDLWTSDDGGAHWTRLQVPGGISDTASNVLVQFPAVSEPWQICVATSDTLNTSDAQPNKLICSTNGGATWRTRPSRNVSFDNGVKGTFTAPLDGFALADDGAVLAEEMDPNGESIYRLPAGGQQWQSLGQVPNSAGNPSYVPTPASGYALAGPSLTAGEVLLAATYTP